MYTKISNFNKKKWGLGIGDWGLGIGGWGQYPKPQPPNPKPQRQLIL
jgi:hypothetical protein